MTQHDDAPVITRRTRAADGRRRNRIAVHLTDSELEAIRAAAGRHRMAAGAWTAATAVTAARSHAMPADSAMRELLAEVIDVAAQVRKAGVNLNQAVRAVNASGAGQPALVHHLEHALGRADDAIRQANETARAVRARL